MQTVYLYVYCKLIYYNSFTYIICGTLKWFIYIIFLTRAVYKVKFYIINVSIQNYKKNPSLANRSVCILHSMLSFLS